MEITREQFILDLIKQFKDGTATLSYTAISKFKRSPKSFIDYKLEDKEQTDAMQLGSLVHCFVLEPKEFDNRYVSDKTKCEEIGGAKPRATNAYKDWKASLKDITVITEDNYLLSKAMSEAVLNNEASKRILAMCDKFETKVEFTHNGLKFVSYIDANGEIIIDLKICADAEPRKFHRDIVNMGYYLQSGTYTLAVQEVLPYYIIAVDRNCGVSVHEMEEDFVNFGINEFDRLTKEFNKCIEANDFHQSFEYRSQTDVGTYIVSKPPYLT